MYVSVLQESAADGCCRDEEEAPTWWDAQQNNTLTLAHANTIGRACPRSLTPLGWGTAADGNHEMPNAATLNP